MTRQIKTKELTVTALMTAVLCILAPLAIPIGPVPISLTNLALYGMLYAVGTRRTFLAYLVYLLLGMAGLPVFSGFTGGLQKLVGPTGGYLIGFIFMILLAGFIIDRHYDRKLPCILGMAAATCIAYLLGTIWLAFSAGMTFPAALMAGVVPFAWEDLLKIIAMALAGPILRRRLVRAGLFPG